MDRQLRVYPRPSRGIEALLAENRTDLETLLKRAGLAVQTGHGVDPSGSHESRSKEPVTVLLGTAAVIAAITPAVKRALGMLTRRPVVVRTQVLVPVEDSAGNVVRDTAGEPILQWIDRPELLEPSGELGEEAFEIAGPLGISIKYQDAQEPDA